MTKLIIVAIILYMLYRYAVSKKKIVTRQYRTKEHRLDPVTARRFSCFLSKDTPTGCLLRHNRLYGESFKNKIPPALCADCKCEYLNFKGKDFSDFSNERTDDTLTKTDIGELNREEFKYYYNSLLAKREDLDAEQSAHYRERLERLYATDELKSRIEKHLHISV